MKQGDRRYTVNWFRSGQPRPYANSVYEFDIRVEWIPYKGGGTLMTWEPNDLNEDLVDAAAKALGKMFYNKGDPDTDWSYPFLTKKTKIGPGHWKYIVTEEYTD